jgi:hypothetical protein
LRNAMSFRIGGGWRGWAVTIFVLGLVVAMALIDRVATHPNLISIRDALGCARISRFLSNVIIFMTVIDSSLPLA